MKITFTQFKTSGLAFGALSLFALIASALLIAFGDISKEVELLLAGAVAVSSGSLLNCALQAMSDPPPNPHQAQLDHELAMKRLEVGLDRE